LSVKNFSPNSPILGPRSVQEGGGMNYFNESPSSLSLFKTRKNYDRR